MLEILLDEKRSMSAMERFSEMTFLAATLDTEVIEAFAQVVNSPLGQAMMPMMMGETHGLTPDDVTKTTKLLQLTLFYVQQVKESLPTALREAAAIKTSPGK